MKTILSILLLACSWTTWSQTPNAFKFEDVVQTDGVSRVDLFNRARAWFASTFRDSKAVLEVNDPQAGELTGKGGFPFSSRNFIGSAAVQGRVSFTITVLVKDGRYKYILTDFTHSGNPYDRGGTFDAGTLTTDEAFPLKETIADHAAPGTVITDRFNKAMTRLRDIHFLYQTADIHAKQSFVRLVFDNQLRYENGAYRTTFLLPIFTNKALTLKEKGLLFFEQPFQNLGKIPSVPRAGLEPALPLLETGF